MELSALELELARRFPFFVGRSRGIEEKRTLLNDRDVLLGGNHLEYAVRIASLLKIRLNEGAYLDCLLSSDGGLFRRAASRRDLGEKNRESVAGGLRAVRNC